MSNQSKGLLGQRMLAFIIVCVVLNITLILAKRIDASIELAKEVVDFECVAGIAHILGRSGVHIAETWRSGKPTKEGQ